MCKLAVVLLVMLIKAVVMVEEMFWVVEVGGVVGRKSF